VIRASATAITRPSFGMPGAFREGHILSEFAFSIDQHVSRDSQMADFREVRVLVDRQRVREQLIHASAAEAAGRQADAVHDDQTEIAIVGPRIAVR
jgi:hypothetical protein